jgi:hypothetical protein
VDTQVPQNFANRLSESQRGNQTETAYTFANGQSIDGKRRFLALGQDRITTSFCPMLWYHEQSPHSEDINIRILRFEDGRYIGSDGRATTERAEAADFALFDCNQKIGGYPSRVSLIPSISKYNRCQYPLEVDGMKEWQMCVYPTKEPSCYSNKTLPGNRFLSLPNCCDAKTPNCTY